jgi:hypothetical protein
MPTRSSRARRLAKVLSRLVAVAVAAVLVAGCSLFGPAVGGGNGPLVSIDAHGGHCLEGACGAVTTILRNGRLTVEGSGDPVTDAVDPSLLATLAAAIDSADYARIMAVPFTGECPTAFDGQELTYTFHPAGRAPITIASCEVGIDPADPLFHTIDLILLGFAP